MASSSLQQMAPMLVQRSKTLLNKDLQKICRAEGVATSGVKSQLQARVTDCTLHKPPLYGPLRLPSLPAALLPFRSSLS